MKIKCTIITSIFVLIFITLLCSCIKHDTPVTSEDQAISIAKKYVLEKYNDDFSECAIKSYKEDNIWIVCYILNDYVVGGGCPEIHIDSDTGQVLSCYLQK